MNEIIQTPEADTSAESQVPAQDTTSFTDLLSEDYRDNPHLAKYKSVDDLARGYLNANSLIGSDKIALPTKNSTPEYWEEVYSKLGRPEAPDKYEVEFESPLLKKQTESFGEFKQVAHQLGLNQSQLKGIAEWYEKDVTGTLEQRQKEMEFDAEQQTKALKSEWGQAYDNKVKAAQEIVREYGGEDLVGFLNETGLGNNPNVIKTFANIANAISEDTIDQPTKQGGGMTPDEAQKEINTIYADPNHPYFSSVHPDHQRALDEMIRLQKAARNG